MKVNENRLFAYLAFGLGIFSVMVYLATGLFTYNWAKLVFYIGVFFSAISACACAIFGMDLKDNKLFCFSIVGLVLSLIIMCSVIFDIFYSYII